MCGIAGIFNFSSVPAEKGVISAMTRALAHRGPDGEGVFVHGPAGLGHRRLAIIDLSSRGAQPMESTDGTLVISYNGEVYNYRELRSELECEGCRFNSQSDTEVVLNAYAKWGAKSVSRLNGMFAFCIYNTKTKTLFIARDRYGIKPLYYCFVDGALLLASEHKAFLKHPAFSPNIDLEGLLEYFTFQNFFTDKTLLRGVRTFPPACTTTVDLNSVAPAKGAKLQLSQYWDFLFQEPQGRPNEDECAEELDRLFEQAVERQLVSDVPLGAYLSGGIDSGAVTALAARKLPYMSSFTCGFDTRSASGLEMAFDERDAAEYMSYLFKTEHYEMVLKSGDMERSLRDVAWHIEEPRVGQSYPNYYASKLASRFVKVVLAGTGGDEIFGGYPWRYYRAVVNDDFEHYVDKYYLFWQRLIPNKSIQKVFSPIWKDVSHVWTRDIFRDVFHEHAATLTRPEDYVNHSLYFEAKTFLHGLLVVDDKLGMAHGLECRVPFLDNDLVNFAMKLPVSFKLGNLDHVVRLNENEPGDKTRKYYEKTRDGKRLLRKALSKYVPESVTNGIKKGFSAPDASWFSGESIELVKSKIFDKSSPIYNYFDFDSVTEIVKEHISGKQNRRLLIWSLLNFDEWSKIYLRY